MLKRRLCEVRFEWHLKCHGPLLIADGRYKQPETRNEQDKGKFPDKLFISHDDPKDFNQESKLADPRRLKLKYYVPGTSLRGPFRAQAERIIRSLAPEGPAPPLTACDPLDMDDRDPKSCSKRLEKSAPEYPYKDACPACKLFGCTGTASRVHFEDAEVKDGYSSVYRDMIGIDRFTGGVYTGPSGGANMRFHVLENSSFTSTVTVQNFELWQLGLLAYMFRDFKERLVPIGFGKTKGFGLVTGEIQKITLTYPKARCDGTTVPHLGSLAWAEERSSYGFHNEPALTFDLLKKRDTGPLGLYDAYDVEPNACEAFWTAVAPSFDRFIDSLAREARS